MAISGTPAGGNNQAIVKRNEHLGQTVTTGTTRKADGTSVEERRDEVTLGDHEQNAAHVGFTGQQGAKETRQDEASQQQNLPVRLESGQTGQSESEVLDAEKLGGQLLDLKEQAPASFQEAFRAEGKRLMDSGMASGPAAGQAAINVAGEQLNALEQDLSSNLPASLRTSESFVENLKANFEADRAAGKKTPAFDILRHTASKEVEAQLAKDPDNAELKAYGDKLAQYSVLDQIHSTGRGLVYALGGTPAGTQMVQANGGQVVPSGQSGIVPVGGQGLQVQGNSPQILNSSGLLSPPVGGGTPPPPTPPPSSVNPGGNGAGNVGGGGGNMGGGNGNVGGGGGVPPQPPPGSGTPGAGQPGQQGPGMSAADQARRMQQILQDQESARDIWMQIWAERQKHEAERWKIMKETMDYWMKTFQESTVNQAMTMQRVNEMWHQYFRS